MIFLEIKYDHQGFTICSYRVWILHPMGGGGGRVCMISKKEICAMRLHTDCVYSEMLPYKK